MADLSREDFQQAFKDQARVSEQHSRDQLSAINGLAEEIRGMASAFTRSGKNGVNGNGSVWPTLFGVGALMFGLMAPMYITIQGLAANLTEHKTLAGHPDAATRLAAMQISLQEIETQFSQIDSQIEIISQQTHIDNQREEKTIASNAAMWERLRFLEDGSSSGKIGYSSPAGEVP